MSSMCPNTKGGANAIFLSPHLDDGIDMHYVPHLVHAPNSGCPRSLLPWTMEQIDSFICNSLQSLSIYDRGDNLLAHGAADGYQSL